jgi:hypothetical protein
MPRLSSLPRFALFASLLFLMVALARCGGSNEEVSQSALRDQGYDVADAELPGQSGGSSTYTPTREGPLRVLSASPSSSTQDDRQPITVTFSKSMVPVGEDPPIPTNAITLDPAVPGSLRWEGTQTLVFNPGEDLPPATEMTATLRGDIAALDGETLGESYTWTFTTERPRLVRSSPRDRARFAEQRDTVELEFSMPVPAEKAASYISVQVDGVPNAYRFQNSNDSTLALIPRRAFPKGTGVRLVLREGLPTTAGALGMERDERIDFSVRPNIRVTDIGQSGRDLSSGISPLRGLRVAFSTPVPFKNLRESIAFIPEVEWSSTVESRDGNTDTNHYIDVQFEPETNYTVRIKGVVDQFGQELPPFIRSFRTDPYRPQLAMDEGLMVVEADQYPILPVRGTNAGSVDLGLRSYTEDDVVPLMRAISSYGRDRAEYFESNIPRNRIWDLGMKRNTPSVVPLRLDSMLTGAKGLVGINMRWDNPESRYDREYEAFAQVTSLGITGKFSPYQNLIFVTRLNDATPVRGAEVEIRSASNQVLWSGETDANGRAQTPGWWKLGLESESRYRAPEQIVIAKFQGDIAVTSSRLDNGVQPYRFGINYDHRNDPETERASVFSDRGLYKVGETVHLKGIVRTKTDGEWSNMEDPVEIRVDDPRGTRVLTETIQPSTRGSFDLSWDVPDEASRGVYSIRVLYDENTIEYSSFRVSDFRRATISVDATSSAKQYVAGDFFEGTISGRYLFGAGMQGQPVNYRLTKTDTRYTPPGYPSYRFGPMQASEYGTVLQGEDTLDSNGVASVRTQIDGNSNGTPVRLQWRGTVTSPADETMSAETAATVHPGLFYIGLKPETTFLDLEQDTTFSVDVVATSPGGQAVGGKEVTVEVVHLQWNSIREVGSDGRLRWRSNRTEEVIHRATVTTSDSKAKRLSMVMPKGGRYEIRATARDLRGNTIKTDTYTYVTGSGYIAWRRDDDDRIEIIPDKQAYAPGETAKLLVQSPYENAQALVTVEREGVLSSRVLTLDQTAPHIDVPITSEHLPNIYVSVILLSGRTAPPQKTSDPGAPGFKMGYASLEVEATEKHLQVDVSPEQTQYRPGEEVTVNLQLTDASGNGVPGEITFAAADRGVLDLIGYSLPDPFDTFYGSRPLNVSTSELRAEIVEQRSYGQKAEDPGGGGGAGEEAARTDFRPLAHWAPSVQTDGRGRAQLTFKLPESLTTFRFMATAASNDQAFGQGETDVVVTKPLVMTQAMPRFARLDDSFSAGVLISNRTGEDGTARVTAETRSEGLSLTGGSSRSINLPAGATREVQFDWQADRIRDAATVRFDASLNGERDAFEVTLPVTPPSTALVDGLFASTEDARTEAIRVSERAIPGTGEISVRMSSTALVGLDGAVEYLFDYPYGCLEQRTSRARPLILANDVVEAFDLSALGGNRNAAIQEWLGQLPKYWTGDGFSLWAGGDHVNWYVSGYVLQGLAEARDAGYRIPEQLTADLVDAIARRVRNQSDRPDYYSRDVWKDTRAQMLFALTLHDRVLEGEIDALATDPPTSADGLSFLLRAIVAADHNALSRFETAIASELQNLIRVESTRAYLSSPGSDSYGWIFSSDTRATAFGLSALIEHDGSESFQQIAQKMVRYLMQQRKNGHWASTQDNAAVVDALRAYFAAYETADPDFAAQVKLAGKTVIEETFQGRSLSSVSNTVGLDAVPKGTEVPVEVSKDGTGRLYYSLRLREYTDEPVEAREQGLAVTRTIQRLDASGEPFGDEMTTGKETITLEPGALVRVQLRVNTPTSRNYVVVDDALPAGLEAVNAAFGRTGSDVLESAGAGSSRWWGSFNHTETRDDRVLLFADYMRRGEHTYTYVARATTEGEFVHPPVEAEMMYQPETRGRTGTGTFIVAPAPAQAQR